MAAVSDAHLESSLSSSANIRFVGAGSPRDGSGLKFLKLADVFRVLRNQSPCWGRRGSEVILLVPKR